MYYKATSHIMREEAMNFLEGLGGVAKTAYCEEDNTPNTVGNGGRKNNLCEIYWFKSVVPNDVFHINRIAIIHAE